MRSNQRHRLERRRKEAVERQAAYDVLTLDEKLARLALAPGNSARELRKINEALHKQSA